MGLRLLVAAETVHFHEADLHHPSSFKQGLVLLTDQWVIPPKENHRGDFPSVGLSVIETVGLNITGVNEWSTVFLAETIQTRKGSTCDSRFPFL